MLHSARAVVTKPFTPCDQSLLVSHDLQVLLDQAVLHPVLADLAGLTVGDQLIGIQSDIEVQVVVDHHLEGLALGALALVLLDGLAVDAALGTVAVGRNSPKRSSVICSCQ